MNKKKLLLVSTPFFLALITICFFISASIEERITAEKSLELASLKSAVVDDIMSDNHYPEEVEFSGKEYDVQYSLDTKLQAYIEKLLKRFHSDFASVVVIDNRTGNIIANSGWKGREGRYYSMNFSATHPSASLFKIITSADLLENDRVNLGSVFSYRGKGTTLYRYQLKNKISRWSRYISFGMAFAHSNNVVFGKAAINRTNAVSIYNTAEKLGFNKDLMKNKLLTRSHFSMPEDQYMMAEAASGFNKKTTISPIHAAVLSSIVANGGKMVSPRLILKLTDKENGEVLFESKTQKKRVLADRTVDGLREMMTLAITKGTARKAFRGMKRFMRDHLVIGGKTGSITGGEPFGKRDWFTMFAYPKDPESNDRGISVAVMNVNVKKWYVKSSFLARRITEYYYKNDPQLLSYRQD